MRRRSRYRRREMKMTSLRAILRASNFNNGHGLLAAGFPPTRAATGPPRRGGDRLVPRAAGKLLAVNRPNTTCCAEQDAEQVRELPRHA